MELSATPSSDNRKPTQDNTPQPPCDQVNTSVKKTLFTPCRRQGLKRKSATPVTPGSSIIPSPSFKNHRHSFETPKRTISFPKVGPSPTVPIMPPAEDVTQQVKVDEKPSRVSQLIKKRTPLHRNTCKPADSIECEIKPTKEMLQLLNNNVNEKEEQLRKLKIEQSEARKGQDTPGLLKRIEKWRTGCQNALRQLHEKTLSLGHQINMTDMVTQLHLPFDLIHYDPDSEDFNDT